MVLKDCEPLYRRSLAEARGCGELKEWQKSYFINISCKKTIEEAIRRDFDGWNLKEGCARGVIEEFGFSRTAWVLSATLQDKPYDGRFSRDNRSWAEETYIPPCSRNCSFIVDSHPAVLDGFVGQYRKAYGELNLLSADACESLVGRDLEDKVLVLSPRVLRESCWSQENQLWLASSGFGCRANATGRAVYATCLWDGEVARWNRSDFAGMMQEDKLPDWAVGRLDSIRGNTEATNETMTMDHT